MRLAKAKGRLRVKQPKLRPNQAKHLVDAYEEVPSPMTAIIIEHFHGAVCRVDPTATAFPHREPGFNLVLAGQWADPADTEVNMQWVPDTLAALEPYTAPRTYMNYAADDDADRIVASYGPNLDRLRDVKRRYDPDNVFRLNQNIPPACAFGASAGSDLYPGERVSDCV
jgi:Berberine and berberine like